MAARDAWATNLADWAIPERILAQAPTSPWIHPPVMFTVPDHIPDSPSHAAARAVEPGSVLDVGCGGGVAAFALVPPAVAVIGVDHQQAMLDMFESTAAEKGVAAATHLGDWPDVAPQVGRADVVTCHHVVYNVSDIVPFLLALTEHAHRRVVLELPTRHPLSTMSAAWQHFWDIARPTRPTWEDLVQVVADLGFDVQATTWTTEGGRQLPLDEQVRITRTRLCLPPERDDEVAAFLTDHPMTAARELAALWWDA